METLYDLSGECHMLRYPSREKRKLITKPIANILDIPYEEWRGQTILRAIYFKAHPEADAAYSIVTCCNDWRCINIEHVRRGTLNPKREVSVAKHYL
jgi:hypothetical protein